MTTRSPLHGYNTNYRRQGVVYHVQTEDLGDSIGAIVTQVFTGGTILGKKRTEYGDIKDADNFEEQLRKRMQSQHKTMLIAVRDDTLDTVGDAVAMPASVSAAEPAPQAPSPPPKKTGEKLRDTIQMRLPPEFLEEIDDDSFDDALIIDDFPPPETPEPPLRRRPKTSPPTATPVPDDAPAPQIRVTPPPFPHAGLVQELAGQQPEPAASEAGSIAEAAAAIDAVASSAPAEPEPASAESSGAMPPPVPADAREPRQKPETERPKPRKPPQAPVASKPKAQRPRIFSEIARPRPGMGEEQLGERSLDEVILSYLADDLTDD